MKFILGFLMMGVLISTGMALSENVHVEGTINAWHDGPVSDRLTGTGIVDYASEGFADTRSSGIAVSDGLASFKFIAMDYSISLEDFQGEIVAESDSESTTVDGNGTGTMRVKSYDNSKPSSLAHGFPAGEINAQGVFEIHATSNHTILFDPMAYNETEGKPVAITSKSEFPL